MNLGTSLGTTPLHPGNHQNVGLGVELVDQLVGLQVGGECGANEEQRQGFYDAAGSETQLANNQRAQAMQGLDKAEGYYSGAKKRLNAAYGDPGTATL